MGPKQVFISSYALLILTSLSPLSFISAALGGLFGTVILSPTVDGVALVATPFSGCVAARFHLYLPLVNRVPKDVQKKHLGLPCIVLCLHCTKEALISHTYC